MSQIKKHTWKGLAVAAAMLLSVGLITQQAFAVQTTTTTAPTTVALSTNAATGTGVYTTLSADIVVSSSDGADFTVADNVVLTAPTGWSFNTGAVVATTAAGGGTLVVAANAIITATTITADVTTVGNAAGTITFDTSGPLLIRPNTANSQPGFITAKTVVATVTTTTNAAFISTVAGQANITITSSAATVASDGTTASTLTFAPRDINGNALLNTLVSVTTSRGTLSATSSTTTSSACSSGSGGTCTLTFRGNGTIGTANINAVTAAPNEGTGTFSIEVVGTAVTPTKFNLRDTTNSGHIGANVTTEYVSTNTETRVRFQAADGNNNGANNELVQATVDKGYIDTVTGCPANNTSASMNSATVNIDGSNVDGVVTFFVCARPGQNGAVKVTVKNLSTSHADGTTTVTSAGTPNKIEATVSGNTVSVVVKDKDGNEVAENTPVFFQVPAFTGAVAPACALTAGGKASGSAAFSGAGGQVLITVTHNSSGGIPGCPGGGNTVSASTTVNIGAGAPPPTTGSGFVGSAPARGSIGLLVTAGATNAASLVSAFATAGCTVESLAVLEGGVWKIYINGAPAVVNSAFPASLPATLAFFVRCAA